MLGDLSFIYIYYIYVASKPIIQMAVSAVYVFCTQSVRRSLVLLVPENYPSVVY